MEECLICNKKFKNKGELSKHLNRSHDGAEKYYLEDLNRKPGKCKICKEPTEFINIWEGYKNTCYRKKCKNSYAQIKRESTFLKKYGAKNPSSLDSVKKKIGNSNKKKSREASLKRENTNKKKYGVKNPYQSDEIKEKIRKTKLERYGNEIPQKTKEIKEKTKKTNRKKYGGNSPQSDSGVFEKSKSTKEIKYGSPNYNNPKKSQKTLLKKTGYKHALQSPESIKKFRLTSKLKFGTPHPMQNEEVFLNSLRSGFRSKKYRNTDIFYQGSYELDFLESFYDTIKDLSRGPRIEYIFNDKKHYYFPDFYIPSKKLIIEIKSKYWNKKHIDLNYIKEIACLEMGYNYILIEDKNYEEFEKIMNK